MVGAQTENETGTQEELDILYIKMAQEKPRKEHRPMTNSDIGFLFTVVSVIVVIGVPILVLWRRK